MGAELGPYLGYVETHLEMPGVKMFDKDCLMLVLEDIPYEEMVSIQIGTLHTDMVVGLITQEEIDVLTRKWNRSKIAALYSS